MKSILTTCTLFLVLPWKLTGETTLRPSSTRQHGVIFKDNETTIRHDDGIPTTVSSKNINSLKQHNLTTQSQNGTRQPEGISTDPQTTIRGEEPTNFSPTNTSLSLNPNGVTTRGLKSTSLHESTSKDHEKNTWGSDEYSTDENENVLSSKSTPQTSVHQDDTSLSNSKFLTPAMINSTEESRSSLHLSSLPFLKELAQKKTITPRPQNISEEVITTRELQFPTRDELFKSTNKGLNRYSQGNRTTRSAEKEFTPQSDTSTHFQKSPEFSTSTETLTTEWSSVPQENESTQPPMLNTTNGTLNISYQETNDTSTDPINITTTVFSTGREPTVNTEVATWDTTDTMDAKTTYEMTTNGKISERKPDLIHISETTSTTEKDNTKTTKTKYPIKGNTHKKHPGLIIAPLIGSILFLMFIAFVVVFIRNRQMKKKQMENTDWAGPSPFIDGDNLPNINEDGVLHRQESKRISFNYFLPQRLSKRFSTLSPTDEEVPLDDIQVNSTFGQHHVNPVNEIATPDQTQTHDANNSTTEVSSDANNPDPVSIPPAPENNENIQPAPKIDDEIVPSPPPETNSVTPTPFEDVDLTGSLDKNTESTSQSDAIQIPSPPPLAPS